MKTLLRTMTVTATATMLLSACSPSSDSEPIKVGNSRETVAEEPATAEPPMQEVFISKTTWGETADGRDVMLYTLRNRSGMVAEITNYGGIVVSLTAPDRDGTYEDVVLGYDSLEEYVANNPYFGALIGRYGNRIGAARFELDGVEYALSANDGANHLHGGEKGFDKVVWDAKMAETEAGPSLQLVYVSADGEQGYPGTLTARVTYTLTHGNELAIDYEAETDRATPVNLTHHSYFNLSGNVKRDILGHTLQIPADHITPVDETLIPTGEYLPVDGTPFDFRVAKPIGQDIDAEDPQIAHGPGYDHNWVIDPEADGAWRQVATLADPVSGRVMTIHSNEPGLQFYSGNFLDGTITGKGGVVYLWRHGLCLETQHFPDSPNQPGFPNTILQAGEVYRTKTVYAFGTDK